MYSFLLTISGSESFECGQTSRLLSSPPRQEMMLMSREREMLRKRDKDIELAIKTLEEVSSKDREEYEKAAENR